MKGKVAVVVAAGLVLVATPTAMVVTPPPLTMFGAGDTAQASAACVPAGQPVKLTAAPADGTITDDQAAQYLYAAGFRGRDIAIGVATGHGESGDPTNVEASKIRPIPSSGRYRGWLQISAVHEAILATGNVDDPKDNAAMAFRVWQQRGNSWTPWQAYTDGVYLRFMPRGEAALARLGTVVPEAAAPVECVVQAGSQQADLTLTDPGLGGQRASDRLTPRAAKVKDTTNQIWSCKVRPSPCVTGIGGYVFRKIANSNRLSKHASGDAADIHLGRNYLQPDHKQLGQEIADYFVANADQLAVDNVIWNDSIWNRRLGWHEYHENARTNPNNHVLRHLDHVHVDVLTRR